MNTKSLKSRALSSWNKTSVIRTWVYVSADMQKRTKPSAWFKLFKVYKLANFKKKWTVCILTKKVFVLLEQNNWSYQFDH